MHKLIKTEVGEHYLLILCPAYKTGLAIQDAFELTDLNNHCNMGYVNVFYPIKKANLRWIFSRDNQYSREYLIFNIKDQALPAE